MRLSEAKICFRLFSVCVGCQNYFVFIIIITIFSLSGTLRKIILFFFIFFFTSVDNAEKNFGYHYQLMSGAAVLVV